MPFPSPRMPGPQALKNPFGENGIEQNFCFPMRLPKAADHLLLLDGNIFRPADERPRPVIVINHGMPFSGNFHSLPRYRFSAASRWFVQHGWVVAVPMRRGYGASDGDCVEGTGGGDNPDFYWAGQSTANDITAVVAYLRTLPFVAPDQIVVLGQSAGGWGTLAVAGRNLPGVAATIAFAPGRGGDFPGDIRDPEGLLKTAARFGSGAKTPLLWLSSVNDRLFSLDLSRAMFDAYASQGAPAEFIAMPAYGEDGHQVFKQEAGRALWCQPVEHFLRTCGIWPAAIS